MGQQKTEEAISLICALCEMHFQYVFLYVFIILSNIKRMKLALTDLSLGRTLLT